MSSKPWERIAWSSEHQKIIYRDWGLFYTHKQQLDIAVHYYDKSLDLEQDDPKALYFRSRCKRNIAQTDSALSDGLAALAIDDNDAPINVEVCDALYELNKFEDYKVQLHENTRKFFGKKVASFLNRIIVVDENFKDTIGESLGPFILKNEKHFAAVLEEIEREKFVDTRPLWKILKEQEKCDVLSTLEKEVILLSPREIARRRQAFKVFNQNYFNKSWADVIFLKNLRKNKNLLLPQSKVSTPFLRQLTNTKYDVVIKFLKLSKYVESVMGDYVVLKTHRVMPWKFEYINEVYNTLALAHADTYFITENLLETKEKERLLVLLRMPTDKHKDIVQFVFGDKSTYQEPDAPDYALIAYKKILARLDKRMVFAKYSIEKCYLLHEIARAHLLQSRFDECCSCARKAAEETKICNSTLWNFLSVMLIVKSHAVLHKIERCKEALDEAFTIAQRLKNVELCSFIEICNAFNDQEISLKKRTQSTDSVRKRRSQSVASRISMHSSVYAMNKKDESEEVPNN